MIPKKRTATKTGPVFRYFKVTTTTPKKTYENYIRTPLNWSPAKTPARYLATRGHTNVIDIVTTRMPLNFIITAFTSFIHYEEY
jgi:hypothetical protein